MARGRPPKQQPNREEEVSDAQASRFDPVFYGGEIEEYESFLRDLGDGPISVTVHRYPKFGGNTLEYCETTGIDAASLDQLRERWGAGKFSLKFKGPNGAFMGSKTVVLAPTPTQQAMPNGSGGHAQQQARGGDESADLRYLRETVAAQQRMLSEVLVAMASRGQHSNGTDPSAMLTAIVGAFQTLKAASDPKDGDISKALQILQLSKDLGAKDTSGADDNMYSVVRHLGDKIVGVFQERSGGAVAAQSMPTGQYQENPRQERREGDDMERWLRAQLDFFKHKARQGKDPEFWVDYVFENAEEPGCAAILYAMERGVSFEHLLQFDKEIAETPELVTWFRSFYNGLRSELDKAVDSSGKGGDAADVGGDEGSSLTGK